MRGTRRPRRRGITWVGTLVVVLIGSVTVPLAAVLFLQLQDSGGLAAGAQVLILGIAAAVAAWYADETRQTTKVMQRPHVHISNEDRHGKRLGGYRFYAYNHGPGVAVNVDVEHGEGDERKVTRLANTLGPGERSHDLNVPVPEGGTVLVRYRSSTGERFTRTAERSKDGWWRTSPVPPDYSPPTPPARSAIARRT